MEIIYLVCLPMLFVSANAQYSLLTSAPFATRDQEFMLTCSVSNLETLMTWSRNGVSVVNIRTLDCYEGYNNQELYNQYRYNCTISSRRYNLFIPTPRINSEAESRWYCGQTDGERQSNIYTLQFYTPPTEDPVITGYDGSPRFLGNRVVLTCTVNGGIPLANLTWTCKGTTVPGTAFGSSTHTVTIDTSYNGKRCSCTASHPTWRVNKDAQSRTFAVHYPPSRDPVVNGYDGSVRYKGDTVTLTCQVSGGSPSATLSWTCDGQPQNVNPSISGTTVTSVLTLNLQKGQNGKTCTCHGRHTDTRYTPDISSRTFIVYYPPSAPGLYTSASTPFPWIEAGRGTLNCTSQTGNPPTMTYQWIRENVVIQGETGDSLIIRSLTRNDNRKSYECKVSNAYTVHKNEDLMSQPKVLDVEYRPRINIGSSPTYVRETKSFERFCTADGNPTPVITWIPNIIPSNGAFLRLINIMRNQTGPYTCRAQAQSKGPHGLLTNQAVLNIIVKYPPSIQAILSQSSIKEGQDVSMTCLAQGVPDQFVYSGWTQIYLNQIIRSSNDFSSLSQNQRNLTLSGVSYQDIGTYRCSANNGIPDKDGNLNQTGEKDLDIKFSAVFNSSRTFYSELNRTFEIKIPFLSNPPVVRANISLTKNKYDQISTGIPVALRNRNLDIYFYGKVIKVNGQEVVVTLHSFSSKLQGKYTIGVKNFQGGSLSTFVFEVIPSGPPESPKNFGVLRVTRNSITVTWLRGFNGGHQQTFVVLYKQKDCKENLLSEKIMEEENKDNYTLVIRNLNPQTEFDFWIYSYNIKGNDSTEFTSVNPVAVKTKEVDDGINMGVIIGVVAAILCVIIALAIVGGILFIRQRSQGAKRKSNGLVNENSNLNEEEQPYTDEQEDEMRINILYETTGANFKKPGTAVVTTYSEKTRGNKSGVDNPAALYAEVQKKKPPIDPSAVYAEVQKPNQKRKDEAKPKKGKERKGNKKDKIIKNPNENGEMGMLYENVAPVKKDRSVDSSGGEVPSLSTGAIPKTKNKPTKSGEKNEDGLIYVDLELKLPSQTSDKKLVIHGSENTTNYTEVDFSRHVAALQPETDDVQNGGKQHSNLKPIK